MSRGHSSGGRSGGFSGGRSSGYRGSFGRSHTHVHFGTSFWWPAFLLGRSNHSKGNSDNSVEYKKVRNKKATAIVSGIFAALCVMFIVLALVNSFSNKYEKINATATSVYTNYEYGEKYFYTSYYFIYNGEEYSVESQLGWTQLPDIQPGKETEENISKNYLGKTFYIYVSKSNPYIIYEVEGISDIPSTNVGYVMGAIITGIIALIIFIVGVNKYEIDKEAMAAKESLKKAAVPNNKRKCEYCGYLADADDAKCKSCGASLK